MKNASATTASISSSQARRPDVGLRDEQHERPHDALAPQQPRRRLQIGHLQRCRAALFLGVLGCLVGEDVERLVLGQHAEQALVRIDDRQFLCEHANPESALALWRRDASGCVLMVITWRKSMTSPAMALVEFTQHSSLADEQRRSCTSSPKRVCSNASQWSLPFRGRFRSGLRECLRCDEELLPGRSFHVSIERIGFEHAGQ
jgi:hypothetical protein